MYVMYVMWCDVMWCDVMWCDVMYVCMCVCMHACMYVCICMYVYVCMCMYVCMYACMYACMHAYVTNNVLVTSTCTRKHPCRPHPFYAVHLGVSNVRLYIQLGRSTRVFREYKFPTPVKLLHSLKIFNKGLILPPPLNFYIHWRSSIRV